MFPISRILILHEPEIENSNLGDDHQMGKIYFILPLLCSNSTLDSHISYVIMF
jgi:hypothetical protein